MSGPQTSIVRIAIPQQDLTDLRQRLAEHFGLTDEEIHRLRGPIGLYIGSKTPGEIAVSVMAEVLAVKNAVALPGGMNVQVAKNLVAE